MLLQDHHTPQGARTGDLAIAGRRERGFEVSFIDQPTGVRTALFAGMALLVLLHAIPPLVKPSSFVQDDSYFYMQIASNIVQGNGSTFHGITPTNGYHPLWMLGAVTAVFLAAGNKALALHIVVILQVLLALAAAILLERLLRAMSLDFRFAAIAVLLTYLLGTSIYGSEAHVNAVMLIAAMLSLWRSLGDDRLGTWFTTGLLLGLAILARLDNVFVVGALGALGVWHDSRRDVTTISRRASAAFLGGAIVLAPYLAQNALQFGHIMPVSGAIKTTVPLLDWNIGRLGKMGRLAAPFGLVALVIGSVLDDSQRRRVLWLGLGSGVVAHALFISVFTDHYTFWPWYYVPGVLAAGLTASFLPRWLAFHVSSQAAALIRPVVVFATIGVLCLGAGRTWLKAFSPLTIGPVSIDARINEYRWNEEFAGWMREHLPPDATVFVTDWPGVLAYYSDRRVFPMDGLVNDFRYNDELLAVGPEAYLCGHGVRYLFAMVLEDGAPQRLAVQAPLFRKQAGTLVLRPQDVLVKVRDVVGRPESTPPYAIWRLTCPGT